MVNWFLRILAVSAVVAVAAPAAAAEQPKVRTTLPVASLFPLEEGNWWVYEQGGPATGSTWRVEVGAVAEASRDRRYHLLVNYFSGPARLVHRQPADTVTEQPHDQGPDTLWYLLGSPLGTSWQLELARLAGAASEPACVSGARLTLASRNEPVRVPAGEFTNAVRVDWEAPCTDAGITSEWFVPGVGLVKRVETSIAGPVTSELHSARIGPTLLPRLFWTTALTLDRPVYWNNLMPPVGPDAAPVLHGALMVRNDSDDPVDLEFVGCRRVIVEVRSEAGEVVLRGEGNDGGCCQCDDLVSVRLARSSVTIPFSFRLAQGAGTPLREGFYTVTAMLDLAGPTARPAATARIEVRSAY